MGKLGIACSLLVAFGCAKEDVKPPMPSATVEAVSVLEMPIAPERPAPSVFELKADALRAAERLEKAIDFATKRRSMPGLDKGDCMARFMAQRPGRDAAVATFHRLPNDVPGKDEALDAATEAAFCINCAAGDERSCPAARQKLRKAVALLRSQQ